MNALTFSPSQGCRWLYLADDERANVVFLLPPDSENLPANISLAESWANFPLGCYIFLPGPLAEAQQAMFAEAARIFLNDPTRREHPHPDQFIPRAEPHFSPRFAWFNNPEQAAAGLSGQTISLYHESTWQTDRLVIFDFGDHVLRIVKNCFVTLKTDECGFHFSPPDSFENEYLAPGGALTVDLSLAIGGEASGAFQFRKGLASADEIVAFIKVTQPEIRYFFRGARSSTNARDFTIVSQRYPLLNCNPADWIDFQGELIYQASLHPLKPLAEGGLDLSTSLQGASLPSHFRTNLGYPIHLAPLGNCRLRYVPSPEHSGSQAGSRYYLTLEGDFEISVPGKVSTVADNLICGLSGVEYIRLSSQKRNILSFIPGSPAFAPSFSFDQSPSAPDGGVEKLTSTATTAWVYVSQVETESAAGQSHPLYFAQPDQAVLFQPSKGDFLEYMEVPASALPPQPTAGQPTFAFPMTPYGSVAAADIENYQKFETGLLSPARRAIIHRITSGNLLPLAVAAMPAPVTGTTPQGLVATYSGDFGIIQSLVLAKDTAGKNLEFQNVLLADPLRAALQSNQLFLVISDPGSIQRYFGSHQLAIQDWMFDLNPANWKKHDTLLVFKFHNQSLQELAAAPQAWTLAEAFSTDLEADRLALGDIIQQTLEKSPDEESADIDLQDRENYRQLIEVIRNPRWNGILAFNVSVPPGGLPPNLVGLASGIDPARFCAQYVGIASSAVQLTSDCGLEIQKSSLFGLIDYIGGREIKADSSGYNFSVSKLSVLFQNSEVRHFTGEIVLVLDKLFDEQVALQNSPTGRNEIILKGRCETQDGRNTYSFSSNAVSRFDLPASAVVNEIEIVKAQFSTDPPAQAAKFVAGETVKSRFTFWGRLDFKKVAAFDILSFGSESAASGSGVRFSNLLVTSSFAWGNAAAKSFAFSAGNVIFDLEKSRARAESLFARFPLKLVGLVESNAGQKSPDDLGYMPVRTPLGSQSPKSGETWYGLVYDLNLGSAGALAGKAGIVVSLLAAWKSGADEKVYTGLRLPGSSGGKKEISIQGILKIAFKRIEILVLNEGRVSYLMKLKNIVLKFMTLELPPNAQSEIIIFGDPSGEAGGENTLAWYAAYARERDQQAQKKLPKDLFAD